MHIGLPLLEARGLDYNSFSYWNLLIISPHRLWDNFIVWVDESLFKLQAYPPAINPTIKFTIPELSP